MRGGRHHVLSPWAFGMDKVNGEASCDGKVLCGHGMIIVLSTYKRV